MTDRIPYARQWIDDDDVAAVSEALRSEFLTTGPSVGRFEADLATATGAAHAVAVNSGTAALHAAYAVLGIGPGDEVIMPPLTFAATANAALYLGARPVFVDVDRETGNIDPNLIEAAVTDRTRAIAAVDFAGQPADYAAIKAISGRHDLAIVADAAHSLGARRDGDPVGILADLTTLSFHPVKHITTGEGGAILSDDPNMADALRAFRSHGIVRDPAKHRHPDGPWYQEMQGLGFNYRITDIQCVLGLSQLRRLQGFVERRREIAARYLEALRDLPGLDLPVIDEGAEPSWHLFVVRVTDPSRRRAFFDAMQRAGLGVQVHYLPVYRHPFYEDLGYPPGLCPNAEDFYARAVSIPLYPAMTDDDVSRVIDTTRDIVTTLLSATAV